MGNEERWQLVLEPHDVLLFRDGRPFTAGEETRARSLFPPTPFTVQGAIRARVLFSSGVSPLDYASERPSPRAQELHRLIGRPGRDYGRLRLRGPLLVRREKGSWVRYFPLPADLVRVKDDRHDEGEAEKNEKEKDRERWELLRPLKPGELWIATNGEGLAPLWARTTRRLEEDQGWLSEEDFIAYLQGTPPRRVLTEETIVVREPRFGIALERGTRTARERHLYLAEFLRLQEGVGFWVEVEGIPPFGPERGSLQLGGEARAAHYRVLRPGLDGAQLMPPNPLPPRFKVVLLTPAWFGGGWQPPGGDWSRFFTGSVRLITAGVPRYQAIGGAYVDDRRRRGDFQKPMRRFVPAGSVYFFETEEEVRLRPEMRAFTETPPGEADFGQIGFGLFAVGTWDYA